MLDLAAVSSHDQMREWVRDCTMNKVMNIMGLVDNGGIVAWPQNDVGEVNTCI